MMPRLFVLLLLAVFSTACSDSSTTAATAVTDTAGEALSTILVESTTVDEETAFDGALEAINQSTVSAQTTGRVMELPFDVGDYVEKNAIIVRFTGTEQRARTGSAEAAVTGANARLAEAQLAFDRTKEVFEKGVVAKAQLDKAAANLDSARAQKDVAIAALTEASEGLGYTVIRAPFAGIVVSRHVQLGETVSPGKPLMTGLSLEHLRAVVEIPQQHIGPLRMHRKARIILPDGQSLEAEELRIPPSADPATHTFRVLVTLPPGEHGVFPGMLAKVAFVSGEIDRLLIPESTVVRRGEVTAVYTIDADDRVSLRYLRLGTPTADDNVPVLAGLNAGERIANDPLAAGIAYKNQISEVHQPETPQ